MKQQKRLAAHCSKPGRQGNAPAGKGKICQIGQRRQTVKVWKKLRVWKIVIMQGRCFFGIRIRLYVRDLLRYWKADFLNLPMVQVNMWAIERKSFAQTQVKASRYAKDGQNRAIGAQARFSTFDQKSLCYYGAIKDEPNDLPLNKALYSSVCSRIKVRDRACRKSRRGAGKEADLKKGIMPVRKPDPYWHSGNVKRSLTAEISAKKRPSL